MLKFLKNFWRRKEGDWRVCVYMCVWVCVFDSSKYTCNKTNYYIFMG